MSDLRSDDSGTQEPARTADSAAADAAIGRSGGDRSEQPGNSQDSMDPSNRDERGSLSRPGEGSGGSGPSDNASGSEREPARTGESTAADAAIGRSGGDRSEQPGNSQDNMDPSNRDERGSLSRPGEGSGGAGSSDNESGSEAGHSELDPLGRDNAGTPEGRHDLGPGAEAGPDDGDPGFEVVPEYTGPDGADGLDYPGPDYDRAAGDVIESAAQRVGQELEGGMSGGDGTSKEGTVPVPRSDATDPDPQKAQADADKVAQFQQEMEGAWRTPELTPDNAGKVAHAAHQAWETIESIAQDLTKGLEGNESLKGFPASTLTPTIPESAWEEIKRSAGMGEPSDS
jgi:hypothetical protein